MDGIQPPFLIRMKLLARHLHEVFVRSQIGNISNDVAAKEQGEVIDQLVTLEGHD
ncbi:hypothetical protein V7306_09440 [Neobacillus vireti]|uniref:hypothetical protein n=1 Tax=Bacillus sp. OTU2372 TaxID=3043858 RepID=UPI00313C5AAC